MAKSSLLTPDIIQSFFSSTGPLAQLMGAAYEARSAQVAMAQRIAGQLRRGGPLLVEAGTGTGKSLAYLLPAALGAREQHQPVIVATFTISLQEQLVHHDLPILQQALARWDLAAELGWPGKPLRVVLAKGWSNYLCRLRVKLEQRCEWGQTALPWLDAAAGLDSDTGEGKGEGEGEGEGEGKGEGRGHVPVQAAGADATQPLPDFLIEWAANTKDGSRSDLPREVPISVWARVAATPEWCLRAHCPYYEDCFFYAARRQLEQAELIVTNQHLLLSDAALRVQGEQDGHESGVLPQPQLVVVDEAHHLEEVASQCLGRRVGWPNLLRVVRMTPAGPRQVLARRARLLFHELAGFTRRQTGATPHSTWRIGSAERSDASWHRLVEEAKTIEQLLAKLAQDWRDQAEKVRAAAPPTSPASGTGSDLNLTAPAASSWLTLMQAQAWESLANQAVQVGTDLRQLLQADDPEQVFWLEGSPLVQIRSAPLEVGPLLRRSLFASETPVILTSATLSVGEDGRFYARRWGVPQAEWLALTSPFRWAEQARLVVPTDLNPPDQLDGGVLARQTAAVLAPLLRELGGRTLVLFTSHAHLQATHRQLVDDPELAEFVWLVQGERPRSQLVDEFRQRAGERAALLATDSFWEGLDLVGPMLSCVVMARLPFPVPDEPLVAARAERIRRQGGSPFADWYLPQAVIRFRQGCGRLLRAATDRGAIVVLDPRLVRKPYGRLFCRCLGLEPVTGRWQDLLPQVVNIVQKRAE